MTDYKVGKMVRKPNPQCRICKNYLTLRMDCLGSDVFDWKCDNCFAEYKVEKLKEKKKRTNKPRKR